MRPPARSTPTRWLRQRRRVDDGGQEHLERRALAVSRRCCAWIVPPCSSTSCLAIASPSPSPPCSRVALPSA